MHILFLSHYFPPEVNAPATRTFEHCRRWVNEGHRVTVLTCAPNCPQGVVFPGYRNAWRQSESIEGIEVIRLWTYLAPNAGFAKRLLNFISYMLRATLYAATMRNVDVVIATSPQFFCGWAGVLCRWIRRWPFVLEIRDIWPESIVTVGAMRRSPVIRLLEWLELRMYEAADHIVTVGRGYRSQLLQRNVPLNKISVIPNGIGNLETPNHEAVEDLRTKWNATGKRVCAYVGTVGMAHGLEVVLEAARMLKRQGRNDVVFWIVGDGAERSRLQSQAEQEDLTNVVFTGLVSKDTVNEVVHAADACLVHLRGTELFETVIPSKIFEIMAAGTPILMGVRGESLEIVEQANAGVATEPDNAESLIERFDHVYQNRSRYAGGPSFAAEHYHRDRLAMQMLRVVEHRVAAPTLEPVLPIPASVPQVQESRKAA